MFPFILTAPTLAGPVLANGDSDGGNGFAFLLLFSGVIFYAVIYFRYRNADKRHFHERETPAQLLNLRTQDTAVRRLTGLKSARMSGANNTRVSGSQNTMSKAGEFLDTSGLTQTINNTFGKHLGG